VWSVSQVCPSNSTNQIDARNQIKSKKTHSSPDTSTIHSIRKEYNITKSASTRTGKGSQAIASFLNEYFSQDDLDAFLKKYGLSPNKPKVIGPNDPDTPGTEASLDIEYIIAVAENISTTFVYTPGEFEHQEPFLDWIQNMLDEGENCALVHSVSYGEYEQDISEDYQERVDKDLQKFVATGRTVLVASGDYGAGCNEEKGTFKPVWPGGSPHITSVGATDGEKEKGVSFSGGGFSNVFGRPDWQKKQVDDYINVYGPKVDIPPAKWYNASGRGYPDIAAFGVDFEIIVGGEEDLVDGTSCSTPVIAGVISLLNEVRLKQGKPHLGFINPLLYSDLVPGLKDITEGRNAFDSCPGFPASEKWDPITGLGSPNVGNLIEILNK
jgi:tripeptidyl-peptidase-1